ncbi:Potassium transporter 5 [Nymphaea thermarum]|nr:Potassium transporter 5 [Nymphaea thermarum]
MLLISVAIPVILFLVQRFGTCKVRHVCSRNVSRYCFVKSNGPYDFISHDSTTPFYWPVFVAAVMASITSSQAKCWAHLQSSSNPCLWVVSPCLCVLHAYAKHGGQVYVPEINFLLLLACIIVAASSKENTNTGNAYANATKPEDNNAFFMTPHVTGKQP